MIKQFPSEEFPGLPNIQVEVEEEWSGDSKKYLGV